MIEIAEWLPDVLNGKLVVHQSLTHIDTHRSFDRFTVAIVCQSSNHGIAVSLRHKPAFFVNLYNKGLIYRGNRLAFVLAAARRVQRMSILVICGVMIGYICSAITEFVVAFAQDSSIVNLHNWSQGSFSGVTWANVQAAALVVLPALAASFLLSKPMAAYQMGEAYARSVGVNVKPFSAALVLLSSLLAACVTAFAGPISFVGIAVPHLVKQLLGSAKPLHVLPGCCLGGAAFCLFCDLLARSLFAPTELSISSVTAVFGAPVVIWLLVRRNSEREGA